MKQRGRPHQVVGKEARALGSIKEELPDSPAVISPQLLHQLRQEERHLQAQCWLSLLLYTVDWRSSVLR